MRLATLADAPAINAWVSRDSGQDTDLTPFLHDPMTVLLLEGNGGAMFMWRGPGVFEVHLFLEQRGKAAITVVRQMLDHIRDNYGARWFWAAIPVQSRHVIMFARLMGWKSRGKANFAHGLCEVFSSENA